MARVVVFFTFTDPVIKGPVSLGFSGVQTRVLPFEVNVSFVAESGGDMPCRVGLGEVISATFQYGELSLGLEDLEGLELGFAADGTIDSLECVFRPANTLSSTDMTITGSTSDCMIRGLDRDTGESFEYRYVNPKKTVSRVPESSSSEVL